jgi:hypothetical protein
MDKLNQFVTSLYRTPEQAAVRNEYVQVEPTVLEKQAYSRAYDSLGQDADFLEKFEGTPLAPHAVALAEQELAMQQRQLQRRMQRAATQQNDNWEQDCLDEDALRLQKQQLLLQLYKMKATTPATQPGDAVIGQPASPQLGSEIGGGDTASFPAQEPSPKLSAANLAALRAFARQKIAMADAPTTEHLQKNMKPGDIVLMTPQPVAENAGIGARIGGSVFGAVSGALQGKYTHAGIYAGNGHVIDIRAETGVRKQHLNDITKDLSIAVVRPKVHPARRLEAVRKAENYLENSGDIHYHMPHLLAAATNSFVKMKDRPIDENHVICSSMVANAYHKDKLTPTARFATKPVDFLKSTNVKFVGNYDTKKVAEFLFGGSVR